MSVYLTSVDLYFDGACKGNPGKGGWGSVAYVYDDEGYQEQKITSSGRLGDLTTNNVAEYFGLINGLRSLINQLEDYEPEDISLTVYGDSKLVINQVDGKWNINKPHLTYFHAIAESLLENFGEYELVLIPRKKNRQADKLAQKKADSCSYCDDEEDDVEVATFTPELSNAVKIQIGNCFEYASWNDECDNCGDFDESFLMDVEFLMSIPHLGFNALENLRWLEQFDSWLCELDDGTELNVLGLSYFHFWSHAQDVWFGCYKLLQMFLLELWQCICGLHLPLVGSLSLGFTFRHQSFFLFPELPFPQVRCVSWFICVSGDTCSIGDERYFHGRCLWKTGSREWLC